jgi:hypothetical protein
MNILKKPEQTMPGFPIIKGDTTSFLFDTGIYIRDIRKEFYKGQIVDCLDEEGIWYSAIIRDKTENRYLVSYLHWNPMWDRWIDRNDPSLQPANTFIRPFTLDVVRYTGECDIRGIGEFHHRWYRAKVISIDNDQITYEYKRNHNMTDTVTRQWNSFSTIIAPVGVHSFPRNYRIEHSIHPRKEKGNVMGKYFFDFDKRNWKIRLQYATE